MKEVVIVSYARTPFGKLGGALKEFKAVDLGGMAIKEAVKRSNISPEQVDYMYFGQVLQGGSGQMPARQAQIKGGLGWETPSVLINKVCCSGISSIQSAYMRIAMGLSDIVVAGGMESMTNSPYAIDKMRFGARMGDAKVTDLMVHDGLWCPFYDRHMALHGSDVAKEYGISREEQDKWAVRSHQYAIRAMENGNLDKELFSVETKKGLFTKDEAPRKDTNYEIISKLPPVFAKDSLITAGNAPGVNDGAGALVLMSKDKADELGIKYLATILDYKEASREAKYIATVPGYSINMILENNNMTVDDIDLFEVNEAFAAVVLVSQKIAKYDLDKVNVDGGAVAYGHPIGATGARISMHLISALEERGGGIGIAAICSGAAQGDAMLLKVE